MKTLTRQQLLDQIENTKGRFFSVVFKKADGTLRTLNGRTGVVSHLRGGKSSVNKEQYITVYDVQNGGYRAVNKDTVSELRFGQEIFICEN